MPETFRSYRGGTYRYEFVSRDPISSSCIVKIDGETVKIVPVPYYRGTYRAYMNGREIAAGTWKGTLNAAAKVIRAKLKTGRFIIWGPGIYAIAPPGFPSYQAALDGFDEYANRVGNRLSLAIYEVKADGTTERA